MLGLDWRTSIQQAQQMGVNKTLQGNLDPSLLLAPWEVIEERLKDILDQGMSRGKHILILDTAYSQKFNQKHFVK